MEFFQSWFGDKVVKIYTDCKALTFVKTSGKFLSPRLQRWVIRLQKFRYDITYIKGKDNPADLMSRLINNGKPEQKKIRVCKAKGLKKPKQKKVGQEDPYKNLFKEIRESHASCSDYESLRADIRDKKEDVKLSDGLITVKTRFGWRIFLSFRDSLKLAQLVHESYCHVGVKKMVLMTRENFMGFGFVKAIKQTIRGCDLCQRSKPLYKPYYSQSGTVLTDKPNKLISCDYLSLTKGKFGFKGLFVMVCNYSGFCKIYPCRKATANFAVQSMKKWINDYGRFERILSDNHPVFYGKSYINFLKEKGIKVSYIPLYLPRQNFSERANQIIVRALRLCCQEKQTSWVDYLSKAEKLINQTVSTVHGFTAEELFIGTKEYDWEKYFSNSLLKSNKKLGLEEKREIVIKKRSAVLEKRTALSQRRPLKYFKKGDLVLVKIKQLSDKEKGIMSKLSSLYEGPYLITEKFGNSYQLSDRETKETRGIFHVSQLKAYYQ